MNKQSQIKAIRGMNDILPEQSPLWLKVESICAELFAMHGYKQVRTPILESTHLFARSIGADTDIVAKEMYTFEDRNGDSLTLRPEGTASTVRAGIENGLFYNQQQRLWYCGPMFRHERPQKGRYRQFHQLGGECYGWSTPDIEAEMLLLISQIFKKLGLQKTNLEINCLGDIEARSNYRSALVNYLQDFSSQLDQDSQRRLTTNPLRILDSKNPDVQKILVEAPNILEYLTDQSHQDFDALQYYLSELDIEFTVNPRLVRGLDYYNNTVFEWINEDFGAQSTVCGGGRYDTMVEQLGGAPTAAFGFALGLERLIQILQEQKAEIAQSDHTVDVYLISVGKQARAQIIKLQQQLTNSKISTLLHCGEASIKNQFKRANKSGAKLALIIGEEEAEQDSVGLKVLVQQQEQQTIKQNDALNTVTNVLESL